MKIQPTCRYGHGDLKPVKGNRAGDGLPAVFVLTGPLSVNGRVPENPPYAGIFVDLFECETCGYLELFSGKNPNG